MSDACRNIEELLNMLYIYNRNTVEYRDIVATTIRFPICNNEAVKPIIFMIRTDLEFESIEIYDDKNIYESWIPTLKHHNCRIYVSYRYITVKCDTFEHKYDLCNLKPYELVELVYNEAKYKIFSTILNELKERVERHRKALDVLKKVYVVTQTLLK